MRVKLVFFALCLATGAFGKIGFGPGEQEWGYVTVRPNAHMFWWLYYTTAKVNISYYEKPLLIWLQGGPGASSTGYGNFEELGPLDLHLNYRNYTWVKDYNILFIDNPIGAGFSFSTTLSGFPKTNAQIAADLLECIRSFLLEFPDFASVPTYITAESYGGKMAAEFANVWYQAQKNGSIKSNLKGVAMGDSWISPIDSVMTWADYLLNMGMVDQNGHDKIQARANLTKKAVDNEKWFIATNLWSLTESAIYRVTNNIDFYNILYKKRPNEILEDRSAKDKLLKVDFSTGLDEDSDELLDELMNGAVKKALGLQVAWGSQSSMIFDLLQVDFMKPVTDQVESLLNNTDLTVLVFTGQLDLIVDTPGTLLWVERLKWRNASDWKSASRDPLIVDNVIEGYIKQYGNLKMYWIDRSGHMVPTDNPEATEAMLADLTRNAWD
ncbi:retinoid-inducible serine carboxypeptidase [Cephus cinctus]|uniref:Carboxypeptidase n=1 Tax=Cephus cinctus TaxID=211228 RepID=A0AAJ7BZL6_CEPCN|nr:retinoid-inducible serine carboxypeptidase [Cephus cinctus]